MKIIIITSLIIVIVLMMIFVFNRKVSHESFDPDNHAWQDLRFMGKRSSDCYKLNSTDCMKYDNCGLCLQDGKAQCVPGDVHGAFFKETCDGWKFTDSFDRHIFDERVTTITPPWSRFYPEFETKWPSPVSVSTLQ